jgi:hypothetical protein
MQYTGQSTTIKKKGATTIDAVNSVLKLAKQCARDPLARDIYKNLSQDGNTYNNLFKFAYDAAAYEPNPIKHQRVRTLQRTIADGRASCVDYTVLIAAILLAGGEPVVVKLVSIDGEGYGHIYVVANDGTILDPVIDQDQSGNEYLTRRPDFQPICGKEHPHVKFLTYNLRPMQLTELNGTNTINATNTINGLDEYEEFTVDGCACQNVNGMAVPMLLNGVQIESKPAHISPDDYNAYLLAVSLGDAEAVRPVNGLRDFLKKRKEKRQERKDKKADKKASKAGNRERRQANRAKRREKWGQLLDVGTKYLDSMGKNMDAQTSQTLSDIEAAGIDPGDNELRDLLDSSGGGDAPAKDNTPMLLGAAALAAFLLLKK